MLSGYRVALVEDDEFMGASLLQRLELEGAQVVWLRQVGRAIGALRTPQAPIDAVICDIRLPDGSGEDLFNRLCETSTPPPFLFMTGHGDIGQAVRLMQAGAADYVTKPFEMPVLLERLTTLLAQTPETDLPALLGASPAARAVESAIARAATNERAVLIRGGPGTGKGLLARRLHALSDRRAAPLVAINLLRNADPEDALLAPGGALDQVGEGVLYLHAIDQLPGDAVSRLLSRIESGFAARLVASCGQRTRTLIAKGGDWAELFYRLGMIEIVVPPLSERPQDAIWLMGRLFPAMNARRKVPLEGIGRLTAQAVRSHPWEGAGRELRARLARGVAAARGPMLQPSDMFPEHLAAGTGLPPLAEAREAAERRHIIKALEHCDGQIGRAKLLQVSRTTLWDKMQKLGIPRDGA